MITSQLGLGLRVQDHKGLGFRVNLRVIKGPRRQDIREPFVV